MYQAILSYVLLMVLAFVSIFTQCAKKIIATKQPSNSKVSPVKTASATNFIESPSKTRLNDLSTPYVKPVPINVFDLRRKQYTEEITAQAKNVPSSNKEISPNKNVQPNKYEPSPSLTSAITDDDLKTAKNLMRSPKKSGASSKTALIVPKIPMPASSSEFTESVAQSNDSKKISNSKSKSKGSK